MNFLYGERKVYLKTLQLHSAQESAAPCWTVVILARQRRASGVMATPGLSLPVATGSHMMGGDQSGLLLGLEKQLQVSVPLTFVPIVSIC